jgi:rhomboid family GlyGly-CTERM serine protease
MSDPPAMDQGKAAAQAPAFPWATLEIAAAAAVIFWSHTADAFIYDRSLILHGQIWRAWTGHAVHFGPSHLFWNLSVFVPAGCWLERIRPCTARWFYAWCPPVITAVLLTFDPTLLRYAGLSGVATGLLVLLASGQLQRGGREPRWFWIGVLALVGLKIALELVTRKPLLVSDFKGIRDVPLAHLGGAGCALLAWAATRRSWAACHR